MRIAIVHYTAPPIIGGVEQVLGEHARLFAARGHEPVIVCRDARLPDALGGCEIVIVHNVLTMPFDIAFTVALHDAARVLPARFIAWTHDVAACNPDLAPVPEVIRSLPARFEAVAVSRLRRQQLAALGVENCRVIPNGVSPARVLGLPGAVACFAERHRLFDGRAVLLHPTRLLRRKNIELGMAAVARLNAEGFPTTLIVTGAADPHTTGAVDYAAELVRNAPGSTVFAGSELAIGDAEIAALHRLADGVIYPSKQEGFGLPMLESALHGLPVFFSEIEPLTELAGPLAVGIRADATAEMFAGKIRATFAASPVFAARKGVLREFSWERIYEAHIRQLVGA